VDVIEPERERVKEIEGVRGRERGKGWGGGGYNGDSDLQGMSNH
jgi:hypothetical protein